MRTGVWVVALGVLSACTQQPAPVTDRGFERFDQGRGTGYAASEDSLSRRIASNEGSARSSYAWRDAQDARDAERLAPSAGVSSAVAVESVGVSELKPLTGSSAAARTEPAKPLLVNHAPQETSASEPLQMRSWLLSLVKQEEGGKASEGANSPFRMTHFIWPADGKLLSHFGPKADGKTNEGVNIAVREGATVRAAAEGEVIYAGNTVPGFGTMVVIRHPGNWLTTYGHLAGTLVKRGQHVAQGEDIAESGSSGQVSAPQLHFSLRDGQNPVDPEKYLPKTLASGI